MNIFILDWIPELCALYHCDKHVIKMILETCQLLYSAHWVLDGQPLDWKIQPYKLTHKNHPCAVWTRESIGNYSWLYYLGVALTNEYTKRYGKYHACNLHLEQLKTLPKNIPKNYYITQPALAMPDIYKSKLDESYQYVVKSYREYYKNDKKDILTYKVEIPYWLHN